MSGNRNGTFAEFTYLGEHMTGEEIARSWKDPDGREEAGEEHPSGLVKLRHASRSVMRAAILGGLMVGTAVVAGMADTTPVAPSILPTVGDK